MKHKLITTVFCLLSSLCLWAGAGTAVKDSLELGKSVAQTPASLVKGEVSGVRVSSVDGSPNGAVNTNIRGLNSLRTTVFLRG